MKSEMLNILVGQKDAIYKMLNGGGAEGLRTAKAILEILRPLWFEEGYTYKYNELIDIVRCREASKDD